MQLQEPLLVPRPARREVAQEDLPAHPPGDAILLQQRECAVEPECPVPELPVVPEARLQ